MATFLCIQWIHEELQNDFQTLQSPLPETTSLCEFLTDGRALCLLANTVLNEDKEEVPKKLQRSLNQLSKFHALERVQFFIKWCRTRAKLDEHQVFTTVQLLDEVNEIAVSETIVALRNKTRPHLKCVTMMSPYSLDRDNNSNLVSSSGRTATTSSTNTGSANTANRLSSFLNKFPSPPVVTTTTLPSGSQNRVSLTSSMASSTPSPRDLDEPVFADEVNSCNNKSRLRIPSIFKGNNNTSLASATSRSSVISNASSTASSNKEEGNEARLRSWSSKLSVFSRSPSSSSNVSAPKTPSTGDLDSNDTPSSSPQASPRNRVSIPSAFSAPSSLAAPKSMSKLSAFLSSVDTIALVSSTSSTQLQDKKLLELDENAMTEENAELAMEDHDVKEEDALADVADETLAAKESTSVEVDSKTVEKSVSSTKLLAFLQAVEPSSTLLLNEKLTDANEEDSVVMESNEDVCAKKEAIGIDEEVAPVEEEVAETESEASDLELELGVTPEEEDMTEDETALELHDEVATETIETSEEEVEEASEDDNLKRQEVEVAGPVAEVTVVSPLLLQENERLVAENDALTQKLETVETAVTTKDTELETVKQELELLKIRFVEEQDRARAQLLAAEKKHEVLAADNVEVRAALGKLQHPSSQSASGANEAKVAKVQIKELIAQNKNLMADLTNLREEVQTLEQSVQLARDSEEAARYAAQVAFAARDSADEVNQQLKNQLTQFDK